MKKIFSAILLMAAMAFSVSTFVACNDLVEDVEAVKAQTTQNAADIAAINAQLVVLEKGIADAKQAAADAKTFAEQCAAEAKAEALQAVADYAKTNDAEIATIKGMIEGIDARLSTLEGKVDEQAKAIAAIDTQIATLKKYAEDEFAKIITELETIKANIKANSENIAALQADLKAIQEQIAAVNDELDALETLVYNVLKSIAYIPAKIDSTLNEIEDGFHSIMRCTAGHEAYDYVTSNCVKFTYRVNPANAEVLKEDLSFIAIDVETRASEYADVFEVVDMQRAGDRLTVTVQSKTNIPGDDKTGLNGNKAKLVALKVANDNYTIVSDYTAVADTDVYGYVIRNAKNANKPEFFNVCWHDNVSAPYVGNLDFYPAANDAIPVELVYSGTVDLANYVETYCTKINAILDNKYNCVDVDYTFKLVDKYISPKDGVTDQQQFVVLNGSVLEVKPNNEIADAEAAKIVAVGKTPVVQVVASVDGKEIAKAYIKVDIVEEPFVAPTVKPAITVNVNKGAAKKYIYSEVYSAYDDAPKAPWSTKASDYMTWTDFTVNVLAKNEVYMSNEQFIAVYDVEAATRTAVYTSINGVAPATPAITAGIGYDTNPYADGETTTTWTGYYVNSFIEENCAGTVTITIPVRKDAKLGYNSNEYKYPEAINLVYKFEVEHETILPELNDLYAAEKLVTVKGHGTPGANPFEWSYEEFLHEAFKLDTYNNVCHPHHTALGFKLAEGETRAELTPSYVPDLDTPADQWQKVIIDLNVDGANNKFENDILYNFYEGYAVAGTLRSTVDDLIWDATGNIDIPVTIYTILDNGNECSMTYTVRFVNPFSVTLANATLETGLVGTSHNTLNDVVIKFGEDAVYENGHFTTLAEELYIDLRSEYSVIGATVHEEVAKGVNDYPFHGYENWFHWTDPGMLYWNNGGTKLLQDVVMDATIYAFNDQIGWFTIAQPATVTLQKNN